MPIPYMPSHDVNYWTLRASTRCVHTSVPAILGRRQSPHLLEDTGGNHGIQGMPSVLCTGSHSLDRSEHLRSIQARGSVHNLYRSLAVVSSVTVARITITRVGAYGSNLFSRGSLRFGCDLRATLVC